MADRSMRGTAAKQRPEKPGTRGCAAAGACDTVEPVARRLGKRDAAIAQLGHLFALSGYVRPGPRQRADPGHRGYELRFGAYDEDEARTIVLLLRVLGIEPGKPFAHRAQHRVPVYGFDRVQRLLEMIAPERMETAGVLRD